MIGLLRRTRDFTSLDILITIYKSLIQPHFEYAGAVWDDVDVTLCQKLQKLQNRAARTITKSDNDIRSADILRDLGWENLESSDQSYEGRSPSTYDKAVET